MRTTEVIFAHGHGIIQSTHKTTFEITKAPNVTRRGDCIIAVDATKGATGFHAKFKEAARNLDAEITIKIEAGKIMDVVNAKGTSRLLFSHPTDVVVRKSDHVCDRTVAIRADKAAMDLSRRLIDKMKNPNQKIKITLTVENY